MPRALVKLPGLSVLRTRALLTQSQLAERAHVHVMTVSDIECGKSARPATVVKIARALNIEPSELLDLANGLLDQST